MSLAKRKRKMQTNDSQLLNLAQAAELLNYSASGLRKLVRRRAIQYFQARPHAPIKFRREWIEAFIEAGSVAPREAVELPAKKKAPRSRRGAEEFIEALLKL